MASKIDTVRGRDSLKPRHTAYWHRVRKGCYVGYRKVSATGAGAWLARYRDEELGKQAIHSLGALDDTLPAARFDAACVAAEKWFAHRGAGASAKTVTVTDACDDYVKHLKATRRPDSADDAMARFKRWVYPDKKLADTDLMKLSSKALSAWRARLAETPVRRPSGATPKEPKPRSLSALNRDMSSLRAALNLARLHGHVATDQAWRVALRPARNADGRRDVYLDATQRKALIAKAPADLAALLHALAVLPLRPGAVAALTAGAFDARLGTLTIGKDKAGRDRKIALPEVTASFFAEQAKGKPPDDPLVSRADGSAWNKDAWKKPLKQAAADAELPAGTVAYALRHSAITDLIALHRLDTMTVAQLAGTSLLMIERNYGHLLREHARTALGHLAL
jgi:integrase